MEIELKLHFKPVAWKRPAGSGARYDKQVTDKVAFSALVLSELNKNYVYLMQKRAASGLPLFTGPVHVTMWFYLNVKDVTLPRAGDLDNMAKFTLDALQSEMLTGVIWRDDRQVVWLLASKTKAEADYLELRIGDQE